MEWEMCEDEYDYHQEIARSGFADMLHDKERNEKFNEGIKRAISLVHSRGQRSRVLDIGTGTGLLSMMAVRAGAQHVTACEAFAPMSECAGRVMANNGMADQINLVHKRSTELTVGQDGDMKERANILVAELLDTELIGEGAIHTYRHAHEHLLTTVKLPPDVAACCGTPSVHDIQLNQLPPDKFTCLSEPHRVFRFDFSGKTPLPLQNSIQSTVTTQSPGSVDAVFMWWDIDMDSEGEVALSCAPKWAHPHPQQMQWRDHWLQAVYYPPKALPVAKGQQVKVTSYHDDYSMWFDVAAEDQTTELIVAKEIERPICTCGLHVAMGRQRIAMLNQDYRRMVYIDALRNVISKDSVCVVISDGSMLPYMAAHLGAAKVYVVDSDTMLKRIGRAFIEANDLQGRVCIVDGDVEQLDAHSFHDHKIDVIFSEPHIMGSNSVEDNFYVWHAMSNLTNHMSRTITILPGCVTVKAIGVEFEDLWKINSPVGECEGFDMGSFDRLIQDSTERADAYLEPHPLWEYPCTALTKPIELLRFDWSRSIYEHDSCSYDDSVPFERSGSCNGVVVWSDYSFGDSGTISNGVIKPCTLGDTIKWDPYNKQNVHILRYPQTVTAAKSKLQCSASFTPENLDFDFKFDVVSR